MAISPCNCWSSVADQLEAGDGIIGRWCSSQSGFFPAKIKTHGEANDQSCLAEQESIIGGFGRPDLWPIELAAVRSRKGVIGDFFSWVANKWKTCYVVETGIGVSLPRIV